MIEALGYFLLTSWALGAACALFILWKSRDGREEYAPDDPLIRRGNFHLIQGGKHDVGRSRKVNR